MLSLNVSRIFQILEENFKKGSGQKHLTKANEPLPDAKRQERHNSTKFRQYFDAQFPNFNANAIGGTGIIMMAGPKKILDVFHLFKDVVFGPAGVSLIIAHGQRTFYPDKNNYKNYSLVRSQLAERDWLDYIAQKFEYKGLELTPKLESGKKEMQNARIKYFCFREHFAKYHLTAINNEEKIQKDIDVYCLPVGDNVPLPVDDDISIESLLTAWRKIESGERVAIHCSGGVGRSGQTALTLLILKNRRDIFAEHKEGTIAGKILDTIELIRIDRPMAVYTKQQCVMAFKNAIAIYNQRLAVDLGFKTAEEKDNQVVYNMLSSVVISKEPVDSCKVRLFLQPKGETGGFSSPMYRAPTPPLLPDDEYFSPEPLVKRPAIR